MMSGILFMNGEHILTKYQYQKLIWFKKTDPESKIKII